MMASLARSLIFLFGSYHLVAGSFMLAPHHQIQMFSKRLYRLEIPAEIDPKYFLTLKFLGLMAIMVALLSFLLALTAPIPAQNLALIFFGLLFCLRSLFRYLFRDEFYRAYRLDYQRSRKNIIFNVTLALVTFYTAWMNHAPV